MAKKESDLRKVRKTKVYTDPSEPLDITGSITSTPGPVEFVRDAINTKVNLDSATPANNRPLPVRETPVNNEAHGALAVTTASQLVVAARPTRKEIVLFNDTNKRITVCPFTPALITHGIIINSGQAFILDSTTKALYVIGDTGVSGNLIWQDFYE